MIKECKIMTRTKWAQLKQYNRTKTMSEYIKIMVIDSKHHEVEVKEEISSNRQI